MGIGGLLGGAATVETVFTWPGMGLYIVDAIGARDLPVIQGFAVISAGIFILVNLGADLLGDGPRPPPAPPGAVLSVATPCARLDAGPAGRPRGAGGDRSQSALEAAGCPRGVAPVGPRRGRRERVAAPCAGRAAPRWRILRRLWPTARGSSGWPACCWWPWSPWSGPRLLAYDPNEVNIWRSCTPPSAAHPLGTDYLGRDVLSRTVDGAHRSLGTAVVVVALVLR